MRKERAQFSICYEGTQSQIDVNTLISTLFHFTATINALQEELLKDKKVDIYVNTLQRGSFIVDLELSHAILAAMSYLFAKPNGLETIIEGFGHLLRLKQLLKGKLADNVKKDSSGNVVVIKDSSNVTVTQKVYNIYMQNEKANTGIEKGFQNIAEDPAMTGFKVINAQKEPVFSATSGDFSAMAQPNQYLNAGQETVLISAARLTVVKAVFEGKGKWDFVYDGSRIAASIEDASFFSLLDSHRLRFTKGDVLIADMEIVRIWDSALNVYINKRYKVTRFLAQEQAPDFPDIFKESKA